MDVIASDRRERSPGLAPAMKLLQSRAGAGLAMTNPDCFHSLLNKLFHVIYFHSV
jgi:hypothetical protein